MRRLETLGFSLIKVATIHTTEPPKRGFLQPSQDGHGSFRARASRTIEAPTVADGAAVGCSDHDALASGTVSLHRQFECDSKRRASCTGAKERPVIFPTWKSAPRGHCVFQMRFGETIRRLWHAPFLCS